MISKHLSRRRFGALTAIGALAAAGVLTAGPASAATAPRPQLARLTLPRPTGPDPIGTVSLHLVDRSRTDPWQGGDRELMASVLYPARDTRTYPLAHQMDPGAAAGFAQSNTIGIPAGTTDWAATLTHAHLGAPVSRGAHPVVLYSPGAGDPRTWGTALVEELASHGYIVITIDHPGETFVQFPNKVTGPYALSQAPTSSDPAQWTAFLRKVSGVREADTRFVLNTLRPLNLGRNPDAEHRALPAGLAGSLDLSRIGMFGQSAGGMDALQTMYDDPRIRAGINMDGQLAYGQEDNIPGQPLFPVAANGLDRPFLLMGSTPQGHHSPENLSWEQLWQHSHGWHRDLYLTGSAHASFTDAEALVPQLLAQHVIDRKQASADIGGADPDRAVSANRAYVTAFLNQFLRGHHSPLLTGPSAKYPEMVFNR